MAFTKAQHDLLFTAMLVANKGLGTADKILMECFDTLLLPRPQQVIKVRGWVAAAKAVRDTSLATFDADVDVSRQRLIIESQSLTDIDTILQGP